MLYTPHTVASAFEHDLPQLNRTSSEAAAELIRAAILDGRLSPGSRLKEGELAAALKISRTPVREALRILRAEGLLESSPHQGSTVRTYEPDDLDELYRLRAMLEGFAARRAAVSISDEDVTRLQESCERFASLNAAEHLQELVSENLFFHNTVLAAAGSERLTAMVRTVIDLPLVYRSYIWYSPEQKRNSERSHNLVTEALAARDAERAELLMTAHIDEARLMLRDRLSASGNRLSTIAGGTE
jgi:DNA-binding GntR family transcriptional regulator